ncbi:MAG: ABC transporter permease subunit [Candidatus Fermentibacteraceae bacterium]|nr:ABC transporter permease subunit [Candidatus Fermentibacteraceae bacterium]MBN2607814.1 ABC transporter permease subunit [Candidatus Fermentibacteraceae bacterium]
MFLNGLEQLARRKIVLTAVIATMVFLGLYWWGISAASTADLEGGHGQGYGAAKMLGPADAALAAIVTAAPLAATLVTALMIVIGATMLPEEMDEGRMPFWLSLPQTRLRVYLHTSLAPLALSYALAIILFGGIFLITRSYFAFTPRNIPLVFVSMLSWLTVVWAAVILLSLVVRKVASMLIVFFLTAVASLFGGLYEIMRMFPGEAPAALVTITRTAMYAFPADRGYRGVLYGLIPRNGTITENLAFFGVTASIPPLHLVYAFSWSLVLLALGYWKFRRMDF